jgi:hypothetical protein
MAHQADTQAATHIAKAPPDDPTYQSKVAIPVMNAVDSMPAVWRALVHEFGYVDVYRAWRKRWTPRMVRDAAIDGRFELP